MSARPGHTLAEAVVVLPLALLLAALVVAGLAAQTRLARRIAELASRAEAERIATAVLPAELRWAGPDDLRSDGTDSVRARIFRGFGVPCGAGDGVTWTGLRAPAPAKDSLLVVTPGGESLQPLTSATVDAACGGYRLDGPAELSGAVVLGFETGTYYLQDRALRYRVGGEGRQPLSDEWFDDAATTLERSAVGALTALRLGLRRGADGLGVEVRRVQWALPNHPDRAP